MSRPLILLLGYRLGAVEAIFNLGFDCVLWNDKSIPRRIAERTILSICEEFPIETLPDELLLSQLATFHFDAIIGVKERSLLLAARLREEFSVPGISVDIARRCHDKYFMKKQAALHHVPITDMLLVEEPLPFHELEKRLGNPFVIKPRALSGRRGLEFITSDSQLIPRDFLCEKKIFGRECSVESFIRNGEIVFSNITDYHELTYSNILPANFAQDITQQLLELNARLIHAFDISRGMTHCEFYLTAQGLIFGELTIRPPGGYIMDLISMAYHTSAWELLILAELNREFAKPIAHEVAACWILHPGAGTVSDVSGLSTIEKDECVVDVKIRCEAGDEISERLGVGEDCGRILLKSASHEKLLSSLHRVRNHLVIVLNAPSPPIRIP